MTTFPPPPIDADLLSPEPDAIALPSGAGDGGAGNFPDQFTMGRQQHISFTVEEAEKINQTLDLMEACTKKRVSPNKLIKQAALQKARLVNQGEIK